MMQSMPPLEHPNQEIQIEANNESKHDTQQLANKDVFEISGCSDYEVEIVDFIDNIVSNNKCRDTFCGVIRCLNPLSHRDAQIFGKHLQSKTDLITVRGWNMMKLSTNMDETTIICYLIEYAHYARDLVESKDKHKHNKNNDNTSVRKQMFDKLNNLVRSKLKLNALSLDVLSLIISTHFVSSLSSKSDGFLRSLLSSYLPSYLTRFTMNATHFMRLFDSVVYHNESELLEQLFYCVNQHIEFGDDHIRSSSAMTVSDNYVNYDHLFPIDVIFYIVKQILNINHKTESVDTFMVSLTTYAMNTFIIGKSNASVSPEFVCLMLNVYSKYSSSLCSDHIDCLYNLCVSLFLSKSLNIVLLSHILCELDKLSYLNKFIKFIADDKSENVNKIFDREIIKKSGINVLNGIIHNREIESVFNDVDYIMIKKSFVCITVCIAKQFTEQSSSSTILLSICAKSMIKFDEFVKNLKRSTIFSKMEFQKLIWCFGFAKYRNDNFWKDLFGKVKKSNAIFIDNAIITKFAWSIARVKSYLAKHKKDNLIHGPMIWCIKNCVELTSKQCITTIFSLQEISTICWSISICGKPNDDRAVKYYIKLFENIVSNTWEIVDFTLSGKPQFYMNILSAILTYKDELIKQLRDELIEFVIHVLNQFNITEQGETYMKNDPNIIDFLLHIAAEIIPIINNNNESIIPDQMIKQINKMLIHLIELNVDITHECAFSIVCTLSRIPLNQQLITNKHKVLNFLSNKIITESKKEYLMLDYTLGLCSAICTNESKQCKWHQNVMQTLLKSAKHYLYDQKDKWSENHFLLKNHLKYFIDMFQS